MAQDEVVVVYKAVPEGFDKVNASINSVTAETAELQQQIKATFADKSIEAATKSIQSQGDAINELVNKYGGASKTVKALEQDLEAMSRAGLRNTEEFKALSKVAADLTDSINDTRGEIKKMASNTKVFDTMVQGARGIAAAFSVATGLAASFGSENKDLQKTLLKVQGAMAALQGVQELANIATEKGGIATKIATGFQAAYATVVGTSTGAMKLFRVALAATGIGLAVLAIAELVIHWEELNNKVREFLGLAKKEKEINDEVAKSRIENFRQIKEIYDNEVALKRSTGADVRQFELQRIKNTLDILEQEKKAYGTNNEWYKFYSDEHVALTIKKNQLEKEIEDERLKQLGITMKAEIATMRAQDKAIEEGLFATTDHLKEWKDKVASQPDLAVDPFITEETVTENRTNAEQMAKDIRDSIEKTKKEEELYRTTKLAQESKLWSDIYSLTQSTVSAINSFVQMGYDTQLQGLTQSKEKEIAQAEGNAERKKKIDQKYAVEFAKIERQKAIAEKTAAIFGIAINLASTVQKIQAEAALLSSNPITAALAGNAYAQLGIAVASAALQIGVISAKPLPEIPKFAKGGKILAGGRSDDGHLIGRSHREGGILIEAQGGEYIWDRDTTAKHSDMIQAAHENRIEDLVMHKYVVPMIRSQQKNNSTESYDDMLLRSTIKSSNKQMTKEIVKGISKNMQDAIYLTSRYKS